MRTLTAVSISAILTLLLTSHGWAKPLLSPAGSKQLGLRGKGRHAPARYYPRGLPGRSQLQGWMPRRGWAPSQWGHGYGRPAVPETTTARCGAQIHASTNTRYEAQRAAQVCDALACNPKMRQMLGGAKVYISGPGQDLARLMQVPQYVGQQIEGLALGERQGRWTCGVTSASLRKWNLGLVHELTHLQEMSKGPKLSQRIERVWSRLRGSSVIGKGQDAYANSREMYAFLGQWYLAGHGQSVKRHAPEVYHLLRDTLGQPRVPVGQPTHPAFADQTIRQLVSWFKTGRKGHDTPQVLPANANARRRGSLRAR